MPTNGEDTSNKKNELINHSVLTNEFINLFTTNFTAKQKETVLKIIEEKDETAHSENGNVVDSFEKLTEQVIGGIEEDQKIDLLRKEKEELEIKIGSFGDKDRDSVPDLEAAKKKLMEIGQQRKIKTTSFDKQIKELKSLTPKQALHSVEPGSLHHLSKIQRFELKRQLGGNKVARITLDREVEELRKSLTKLKKHKLNQIEQVSTDLKKLDEIGNVNEKFLTAEEKEKVREIHQIENIAASHSIERTPSFSKLVINKDDNTDTRLMKYATLKNATQDFLKSAGKRVWNNKWTIASMIALTTVFAVTGGTFLAAAFPAFAGSVFGAVVLAATTAFVICGATLLADKLILKPIQNRLASRENKNRDQVVMERFAQDKEKGQHFSLDKAFSENVASIAKTENKEQTITQEQTNKKENTIDTRKQEIQPSAPSQSIAKAEEQTNKKENTIDTRKQEIQPSVPSQSIVKTEEQRKTTVAIVHQENNKRPFKEVTSDANEKARRASISGAQEKNKNEKQQVVI